jgi:hypothetical protein
MGFFDSLNKSINRESAHILVVDATYLIEELYVLQVMLALIQELVYKCD